MQYCCIASDDLKLVALQTPKVLCLLIIPQSLDSIDCSIGIIN